MYTARAIELQGLGAIPVVILATLESLALGQKRRDEITRELFWRHHYEMQRMNDAQLVELSLYLGQATGTPDWEWFNTLRSARDMGLYKPNGANGNGVPPPVPKPKQAMGVWIGVGAAVIAVLIALK